MPTPYEVEQQLAAELEGLTTAQETARIAAWAAAWSEISGDLRDTLAELMDNGTRITAALIVRSERLAAALAAVADRLEDLTTEAGVTMTADLATALDLGVDSTGALIAAQLDDTDDDRADLFDRDARPVPAALEAIIERTTQRMLSDLLPVADDTYAVIQRELVRGVAAGTGPRETAQRMVDRAEDYFNFGLHRANTIARTETLDAYRAAAEAAEEPHADLLTGWVWLAHLGPRTCRSCLAMHGRVFDRSVAGPKDHQQGRCSRCPLAVGRDGGDPDTSWVPDADDHFASLTVEQQQSLLGVRGYAAWVAGDFPRSAWSRTRRTAGWRDSQVPAPAPAA